MIKSLFKKTEVQPRVVMTTKGYILKCADEDLYRCFCQCADQTMYTSDISFATQYNLETARELAKDGEFIIQEITITYVVCNCDEKTANDKCYILEHIDGDNLFRDGEDQSLGTEDIRFATKYDLALAKKIAKRSPKWRIRRLKIERTVRNL